MHFIDAFVLRICTFKLYENVSPGVIMFSFMIFYTYYEFWQVILLWPSRYCYCHAVCDLSEVKFTTKTQHARTSSTLVRISLKWMRSMILCIHCIKMARASQIRYQTLRVNCEHKPDIQICKYMYCLIYPSASISLETSTRLCIRVPLSNH